MVEHTSTIVDAVRQRIGERDQWAHWPGGWKNEISTALIDAVFSARAVYRTSGGLGVHALVSGWRSSSPNHDSLSGLSEEIRGTGSVAWADRFGSKAHAPGRHHRRPSDPTKAGAVVEAASALVDRGIDCAADVRPETKDTTHTAMRSVPGIGAVTADYFLMLLGVPGVKADVMIHRFLEDATHVRLSDAAASAEVAAASAAFGASATELDHAIWAWQRAQS